MTTYPYEPPARLFEDTMLAYRDWNLASTWSVRVEPDPLGPVNQIVRLMRGGEQVRAGLARIPEGARVRLVRDEGGYRIEDVFALRDSDWSTNEHDQKFASVPFRVPGWRVEVDDRTVLAVTDTELAPKPAQIVSKPFWTRLRRRVSDRARSAVDGLARRAGYHRDDQCEEWDE